MKTGILKINEIFYSIQGESTLSGLPMVFVRLTGCSLRCTWCDTDYAFYAGQNMSVDEILEQVESFQCPLVEVTGGEPLDQAAVIHLMQRLIEQEFQVNLETSGAKDIRSVPREVKIIMDIKCPGSGMTERMDWKNLDHIKHTDEIKFVIKDRTDYLWAKNIMTKYCLNQNQVLFSPVYGIMRYQELADWILEDHLNVRYQIQMHKVIGVP